MAEDNQEITRTKARLWCDSSSCADELERGLVNREYEVNRVFTGTVKPTLDFPSGMSITGYCRIHSYMGFSKEELRE